MGMAQQLRSLFLPHGSTLGTDYNILEYLVNRGTASSPTLEEPHDVPQRPAFGAGCGGTGAAGGGREGDTEQPPDTERGTSWGGRWGANILLTHTGGTPQPAIYLATYLF